MNIIPVERLRYHVVSRSRGVEVQHVVDVGSLRHNGVCLGRCTCEAFTIDLYPAAREFVRRERQHWVGRFAVLIRNKPNFFGTDDKRWHWKPSNEWRCPHILAVRAVAFDEILDNFVNTMVKQFDDYKGDEEWQ